jgi:hypothetical protein
MGGNKKGKGSQEDGGKGTCSPFFPPSLPLSFPPSILPACPLLPLLP